MKFNIIYADCPWEFSDKLKCGNRGSSLKYGELTFADLKNLPINKIAADDCVLCLWCPAALLPNGLDLIKEWGFEYKTILFNWVKLTRKHARLYFGLGHYTRGGSEFCLLGVRGKPKVICKSVRQVQFDYVGKQHSHKPDKIRKEIVKLFGDVARIELFARQRYDGWLGLGDEIDFVDIRESLQSVV